MCECMDNFFFGLQGLLTSTIELLRILAVFQLFWGFVLGFLVSTVLHAFLISDNVKNVPFMMFTDKAKSFEKMYPRDENNPYQKSYADFSRNVDRMKTIFYIAGTVLIVVLMIVITSFK